MHNCSNVQNQSQNSLTKKHRSNDVFHMNHNNLIDSQIHHDPNSNVTFHQKIQKHHHVPPPVSSNMQLVNSSSSSVRRVHSSNDSVTPHHPQQSKDIPTFDGTRTSTTFLTSSHPNANDSPIAQNDHHVNNVGQQNYHHQQTLITNELTRYALTRYAFPPYILRFKSGKVTTNQVKEGLIDHCKQNHQMIIQVANCRLSNVVHNNNESDILLYLKDVASFSLLLDHSHWPITLGNENYSFPSFPSIPP
ncbi:unnamed protein product [Rotaria sordida]|uniref:Uncharacterized protein n=1 Tax=Rotaria sordida TaxID=392033 RepID=A0A813UZA5_9BILA|nr:unnamed protein product [Rotaria sordida]CAF3949197.1 unnamed protein product [Rotaria sordida]